MLEEMSVASTYPAEPTRLAAAIVCPPAPAATSSTRAPGPTSAISSITSVAWPSHSSTVGPQRCHGSAAVCHCSLVVALYLTGSNCGAGSLGMYLSFLPPRTVGLARISKGQHDSP